MIRSREKGEGRREKIEGLLTRILKVSENDIHRIFEIEKEAFFPPWTYESLLSEVSREDSYFITAMDKYESGEFTTPEPSLRFLGYAILRQIGDDGELLKIAVDKQSQRKGVGALLMAAVIEHAAEKAFKSIFLEVREMNAAAVKLYEKCGFDIIRVRKDYYNDPVEDALIMKKECQ